MSDKLDNLETADKLNKINLEFSLAKLARLYKINIYIYVYIYNIM